jgi:hypothetical protein
MLLKSQCALGDLVLANDNRQLLPKIPFGSFQPNVTLLHSIRLVSAAGRPQFHLS